MLCKICGKYVTGSRNCLCCGHHYNNGDLSGIALPDGVSAGYAEADDPPFNINDYLGSMNAGGAEKNKPAIVGFALSVISVIITIVLSCIFNFTDLLNSQNLGEIVPVFNVPIFSPASAGVILCIIGIVKSKKYHNGKAMSIVGLLLFFTIPVYGMLISLFSHL